MKLYYAPGTCSLAPHILLREAKIPFELERVDLRTRQSAEGKNLDDINPKGSVPVLEFDDGARLTEGTVIAQYIGDLAKNERLMPAPGTLNRYRVMEWQAYISTELHKFFWPLFHLNAQEQSAKAAYRQKLEKKLSWVSKQLRATPFLTGEHFTAADAYLFAITRWAGSTQVDISEADGLQAFMARVAARPAVQEAMQAEGLMAGEEKKTA